VKPSRVGEDWEDDPLRFVETNVFLYVITAHPEFGPTAKRILERIDSGEEAATSSLVLAEVCAWLEYRKKKSEVGSFLNAIDSYPSLRKFETTYPDELRAKELERSYPRLEYFDRVYLAQMERLKLSEIYSNDRAFDRVKGIKRIFE
jgi:predicted nucleic acid-binding protein